MIKELAQDLIELIFDWGYLGIFLLMCIESSFIPFPSEIILIPAGFLASEGKMSLSLIMLSGLGGSMVGAFINYYLALLLGRKFLVKFGKYFFIKESTLEKMDNYFVKYGAISTFTGRLVPGIRQLISIPAGISRMHLGIFSFYTALGSGIWALILTLLGYYLGENQELLDIYLKQIIYGILTSLIIVGFIYYKFQKRKD